MPVEGELVMGVSHKAGEDMLVLRVADMVGVVMPRRGESVAAVEWKPDGERGNP